jgi:uncharacterized protein (TIGR02266 family)
MDMAPESSTRVTALVRVELTLESESHFYAGLRGDVASGGIFVATYRNLMVGDAVLLELRFDGGCVAVRGTVAWRTPGGSDLPAGVGVALRELSSGDRATIQRFCAQRPPFYFDVGDRASVA